MLITFFFIVLSIILEALAGLLSAVPVFIPPQIADALAYFAGYLVYVKGIVNIRDVFNAITFLLTFITSWYSFKLVMWVWHLIPKIGKKDEVHAMKNTEKSK